jgi:hypothetical protein
MEEKCYFMKGNDVTPRYSDVTSAKTSIHLKKHELGWQTLVRLLLLLKPDGQDFES